LLISSSITKFSLNIVPSIDWDPLTVKANEFHDWIVENLKFLLDISGSAGISHDLYFQYFIHGSLSRLEWVE
jgi:hypothetical protein